MTYALVANANFWISAAAAFATLIVLRSKPVESPLSRPFIKMTLLLKCCSWVCLAILYIALKIYPPSHLGYSKQVILALVDAGSLFSLWSSITLLRGKSYDDLARTEGTFLELSAAYILLLLWNFSFPAPGSRPDAWWLVASALTTSSSNLLACFALGYRYGWGVRHALLFIVFNLVNLGLQIPGYGRVFYGQGDIGIGDSFGLLAFFKGLNAVLFYQLILSEPRSDNAFHAPEWVKNKWISRSVVACVVLGVLGLVTYLLVVHNRDYLIKLLVNRDYINSMRVIAALATILGIARSTVWLHSLIVKYRRRVKWHKAKLPTDPLEMKRVGVGGKEEDEPKRVQSKDSSAG